MPRVEEIRAFLEELAPSALAEEWDNVGTLVDCGGNVTSVMTALDITGETLAEAELSGCQLIVSHHPVIFRPLRRVDRTEVVYRMIKKSISGICMHTNLDTAAGGVNDQLAALFGLGEVRAWHKAMDGQSVPYNELFRVPKRKGGYDLMYCPGDRSHGASGENIINCRCFFTTTYLDRVSTLVYNRNPN